MVALCVACAGAASDPPDAGSADEGLSPEISDDTDAPDGADGEVDPPLDASETEVDAAAGDDVEPQPEIGPDADADADSAPDTPLGELPDDSGPTSETQDASDAVAASDTAADTADAETVASGCPDPTADDLLRQALILSGQNVVEVSIGLTQTNIAHLRAYPYQYVSASFSLADASGLLGPYEVAVRLKGGGDGTDGGSFQDIDHKPSFKVDMNRVVPCQALAGLTKLTLNNMVQDPSMLHEWVAYGLYRDRDLPSPRVGYAWVVVNGQEYGLYSNIEVYDQASFRHTHLPSTQHLYEGQSGADFSAALSGGFEVDHGDTLDRSDLNAAIAALVAAPPEGLVATTNKHFDWPAVATFLAIERFTGQQDGYIQQRNNFYAHSDKDGRFTLMPWGHDTVLATPLLFGYLKGNIAKRCLRDPDCHLLFEEALAAAAQEVAQGNLLGRIADRAATLAPWVKADPRRPYSIAEHLAEVDVMAQFIEQQPARFASSIACVADTSTDFDGDGHDCLHDCDDTLATVYPGSVALCP
jgi:hypothetical protein